MCWQMFEKLEILRKRMIETLKNRQHKENKHINTIKTFTTLQKMNVLQQIKCSMKKTALTSNKTART